MSLRSVTSLPDWPTSEMAVWTGDEEPVTYAAPVPEWGTFTDLGPFIPKRGSNLPTPYAYRREYSGARRPKLRWGQIRKAAASALREAGDFLVGAFQPVTA